MRYENDTALLSFIQFVAELMNFNALKIFCFGVISSYFILLSVLLSYTTTWLLTTTVT